ncbi:MAG TPA: glycoside hydrolase family 38 C-terminal domain-containing protein [Phycisphaerae bacterium]|nr:glycoside hydrolase family 38 C-terminal domain-containing protein [Phycisphaerae bacterium]HOJ74602.1 glycoside hydrolase family 38 C-terminal domain-containing protein [Phycisphaerae bacterium]HOM50501.1 glycoside hydrolase family 38 C-terminal domain-containing protein [Phycisphaerae bacterium]HOQ87641.1 glycoside hydrolase family 38 C-terminal domain-containing protein [Phycisphaerae bacterium]HPP28274.1 glycoside hydrolase family 38 C-terminal domain-containing protein [Phycisphaerae ba
MSGKRTGHYVVSTHWDREWYQSFQHYRFRLVSLLDEVLDVFQREPRFRYFQMDGQSIPIEDYLEVRPEREPEVRSLTEEGRLRLGPWYVLPDEFLVSGESIIRNLQLGISVASRFGKPSRVGFCCDMFGHISQLPQIFRGFGIDNAFVWRGVNESTHGGMFRWQAPDGSEVITFRFSPKWGYCTYAFWVRHGHKVDEPLTIEDTTERIREIVEFECNRTPTSAFLLFDGGDHLEIVPETPDIIERANKSLEKVEIVHSHLDGFVEDLREERDKITKVFVGELREPGEVGDEQWLIPGVASSRVHLKQANARCEDELCLWAEPFSTFAALHGMSYPRGFLDVAWKHLLQNHPHDSICGCSIDQPHKDMEYRFDQCIGIAAQVTANSLHYIAERVTLPEVGERDLALVVFNPSADAVDGPVDLTLRFPKDIDAVFQEFFHFEPKIGFRLFDADGNELPYQYVTHRRDVMGFRRYRGKFPQPDPRHEVDVTVPLKIPAYGYTTVICRPAQNGEPVRYLGSMAVDDHTIEGDKLRVSVASNGTITLTDKRTGESYHNLLTLEDCADIGDGWYHGVAVNDQAFSSIASSAEVSIVEDGLHKATLVVRVTMNLPECFLFDSMRRSSTFKPMVVTHYVTLRRSGDSVEVRTVVDNNIRDHRLRVLFPTNAEASTYLADQAFDVVERPIALRADNARYKELEIETRPQQTWTAVFDKKRGLAVVSTGLRESAVRDQPARPIALTLLRSFIKAVLTNGNEGGEIQGRHEFRFRIVPLAGAPDVAALTRLGQAHSAGIRVVQFEHRDVAGVSPVAASRPARVLPATHSFMEVSPSCVVTAIHQHHPENTPVVRLFNPTQSKIDVSLQMEKLSQGVFTDLEGRAGDPVKPKNGKLQFSAAAKKIVTIRLT